MRILRLAVLLLLALTLLPLAAPTTTPVAAGQTQQIAPGHVPAGLSSSDWASIQAQLAAPTYFKASNTETNDGFGYSVSVDGNTVVVGAYTEASNGSGEGDNSALVAGAAYVFVRSGTTWSQQAYLKASNAQAGDRFGYSVAISGDTIVIGADGEDSNGSAQSDNSAPDSGAAYVFVRSGNTWSQQAYLKASNAQAGDYFGSIVAISSNTIVVGAYNEDSDGSSEGNNSAATAGAAYVFVRSGTTWSQQAYLKASNVQAGDYFGTRVAISGETLVVSAMGESSNGSGEGDNSAQYAGAAYVFVRSGSTWSQQAYLKASNTDAYDFFGRSVAISGDTIVVSADNEDSDGSSQGNNSAGNAGAAYVFVRSGTTWSQQAYLKAATVQANDNFGYSVAISGDALVVGAHSEDSATSDPSDNSAQNAGAAYLFVRSGNTWIQESYLKASNTDAGDLFGSSVAISGNTLVVGANGEASNATGVDGNQTDNSALGSGAAYLFSIPRYASNPTAGSTLDVGDVAVGSTGSTTLTISETGDAELSVSNLALSGAGAAVFSVAPTSFSIADGAAAQSVTIECSPATFGSYSATLTVTHNAPGSSATYPLTCTGFEIGYASSPTAGSTLDLGDVLVGNTGSTTLTISETGNTQLTVSNLALSGAGAAAFSVAPTSFSIADGAAAQSVTIECNPADPGSYSATLTVTHNAPGSSATYPLTCTGLVQVFLPFVGKN
ncbi:alpha beta-propellor repeat-containing integrin [Oscillochloris trichoides DG-6]|uniref:Alpha beta-propellor repeat-containing integrin n=1 Tax=Oscillochloris trichoides DG-6 TaxID=765420 RepID=E1IDV9_9CHLR|nr:alpha beta-propellor repeat-containing integrin [Oscillochloris trichoides DG-6]